MKYTFLYVGQSIEHIKYIHPTNRTTRWTHSSYPMNSQFMCACYHYCSAVYDSVYIAMFGIVIKLH